MSKVKGFFGGIKNFASRNKGKFAIIVIAIIVVVFVVLPNFANSNKYTLVEASDITSLQKEDFVSSVSESGKIVSEDSVSVYPEISAPVETIDVEIGDVVKKGDVIATLDSSSIQQQIDQTSAAISATKNSAGAQIKSAQDSLNEALENRANGTNSTIVSAKSNAQSAYDQWQSAERTYQNYKKSIEEGYNESLVSAGSTTDSINSSVSSAQLAYNQAVELLQETENTYNENTRLADEAEDEVKRLTDRVLDLNEKLTDLQTEKAKQVDEDIIQDYQDRINDVNREITYAQNDLTNANTDKQTYKSKAQNAEASLDSYRRQVEQAELSLNTAQSSNTTNSETEAKSDKSRQAQLETYRAAAETAKNAYDNALVALEVAQVSVDDQITALENSLRIAQAAADTSTSQVNLNYYKDNLEKATITAPIDGTITSKNMEIGLAPVGAVAVIETVDEQVIESTIKEYDLNSVSVGQKVQVTSDALGKSRVFEGEVISIDPTPSTTSTDVVYNTKIKLIDTSDELSPGMTVRVKYILEERASVYTVSSTAIYTKNSKNFILVASSTKAGTELKEIEVIVGSENDVDTVIQSSELRDGMIIITAPDKYSTGEQVEFNSTEE